MRYYVKMPGDADVYCMTYTQKFRLIKLGVLEASGKTVRLTQLGRWQAITQKLNLHPVELFILADMYVDRHLRKENNMRPCPYAFDVMDQRLTEILDVVTIYNKKWKLKRQGAIDPVDKNIYNLTDVWVRRLEKYHDDVLAFRDYVRKRTIVL